MATAILLVGPPGAGKTTCIRSLLRTLHVPAEGFFTAEVREAGGRVGFALEDLAGRRGLLAWDPGRPWRPLEAGRPAPDGPRVGRYLVDVTALDALGVAALQRGLDAGALLVIDEIGKMEACSPRFRAAVERALDTPEAVIVGTILQGPHPWVDRVKTHPGVTLIRVTPTSRAAALETLGARVRSALAGGRAAGGRAP